MNTPGAIGDFLREEGEAVTVRVVAVHGSAPREAGAWMMVSRGRTLDTIGGGRLEYMAIDAARAMLEEGVGTREMDVPLGPEIGQCCGGRVRLALSRDHPRAEAHAAWDARPAVYLFGAGHVGRAMAHLLQHMPFHTHLVDTRSGEVYYRPLRFQSRPEVERIVTPLPEAEIGKASPGAAYVIATHDHGLDFLLTEAALERGDAAYVGLIGSATKRARFERQYGGPAEALTCPIGGPGGDKRPAVIAALTVADVTRALTAARA